MVTSGHATGLGKTLLEIRADRVFLIFIFIGGEANGQPCKLVYKQSTDIQITVYTPIRGILYNPCDVTVGMTHTPCQTVRHTHGPSTVSVGLPSGQHTPQR